MNTDDTPETNEIDDDRLLLLDRISDRLPDINLDEHEVAWHQLPDGSPALLVDGGGMDGKEGMTFANVPGTDDLHGFGPVPAIKSIASMLIRADGTRVLHGVTPDPLAKPPEDIDE
jgi:hypothetical protein